MNRFGTNWTGAHVTTYCTPVGQHHFGEDEHIFPLLAKRENELDNVLDRLTDEHRVIHDLLIEIDRALIALVAFQGTSANLRYRLEVLGDALTSHLAYEERKLLEPMARYLG